MPPINKFYAIKPGESMEELKKKRGISLCELLDELDRLEEEDENQERPIKDLLFENLSEEDRLAQIQLKKLRGAFNKLAPDNFYVQLMEIQDHMPVHCAHLMKVFVKLIVEKAADEEKYSLLYAHVCKALKNLELLEVEDENLDSFGSLLMEEVYNVFCYNRSSFNWWSSREPSPSDIILMEEKERMKRRTLAGVMSFIGNLFKAGMIDEKDVFCYVKKLEQEVNEKSTQALCRFLTTAGKELEMAVYQTEFESDWNATWERIVQLSNKEQGLPTRLRFLLMEVLDLRKNRWVPRLPQIVPRTYVEISVENQGPVGNNETTETTEKNVTVSLISQDPLVLDVEREILNLMGRSKDVDASISNWEIVNYKGRKTWFIYAMTRAVLTFCIVGNSLDEQKFAEQIPLLKKYVNSRQAEVASMYAVQYIVVVSMGNPKGLLQQVCETLYRSNTISYIAFLDWRENWSKSPILEIRGKAETQVTLASFFIKLFWESTKPSSRYKSIVKELNSFDLEHFVSMAKLPPEIGKRIKMEEEREKSEMSRRDATSYS